MGEAGAHSCGFDLGILVAVVPYGVRLQSLWDGQSGSGVWSGVEGSNVDVKLKLGPSVRLHA